MFAVIKTGGKQFRVAANDTITVPKLEGEPGASLTFDEILMMSREGGMEVGAPGVSGASVAATLVEHTRGEKVIAFKKRRRKNSRRKRGHRQDYTVVRIGSLSLNGQVIAEGSAAPTRRAPVESAPVSEPGLASEPVPGVEPAGLVESAGIA